MTPSEEAPRAAASVHQLRELAESCARLGGDVLKDALRRGPTRVREKARNDFVTEVDTASEAAIGALLRERRPGDRLLAEEEATGGAERWDRSGEVEATAGAEGSGRSGEAMARRSGDVRRPPGGRDPRALTWIVDPLDGTKNFIHGYPAFGVSVAVRDAGGLLAGAIYDPMREELWSAGRGAGATLDGESVRVTSVLPAAALVGTGFPFRHARLRDAYLESFSRVLAVVSDVRRAGSASLDLAYVACGRLDGFWELGLSPWDIAAGWLLIEEAGGSFTDERGGPDAFGRGHVVAGGPAVHTALLDLVRPAFEGRVEPIGRWTV